MTVAHAVPPRPANWRDYLELAKARIVLMVLVTTAAGFTLAAEGAIDFLTLTEVLIGTALVAGGTNALNEYMERRLDAQMARTRKRPLPSGRMATAEALAFSVAISVGGFLYLGFAVNWLSASLALFTLATYLLIYTPLKQKTTLCTVIGAVPGAIPPMIGWAAVAGRLEEGAWLLFTLMFLWQLPHFFAIAWIYREDYGRAGFRMVSVGDEDGTRTARHAFGYSVLLFLITAYPGFYRIGGITAIAGLLISGAALLGIAQRFRSSRTMQNAKSLFMTSNIYLLVVMTVLLVGKSVR